MCSQWILVILSIPCVAARQVDPVATTSSTANATVPAHLFMPVNPPAPGRQIAEQRHIQHVLSQRTTNYNHATLSQQKNIELVARRLNGVIVQPGSVFSYNRIVGPYTKANGYHWGRAFSGDRIVPSMGGGVCQGASTLYSALLHTDLRIVERHNHGLTVPYLPAGEDATVAESAHLDFRFQNTEASPVLITARAYPTNRFLTVCIWGTHPIRTFDVHHRIIERYHYNIIYKRMPNTHPSTDPVLFPGQDGAKVVTWVEPHATSHPVRRQVSVDTYLASPRVMAKTSDHRDTAKHG